MHKELCRSGQIGLGRRLYTLFRITPQPLGQDWGITDTYKIILEVYSSGCFTEVPFEDQDSIHK